MNVLYIRDKNGAFITVPAISGKDGKTAYQYAVEGGYTGTEAEFADKLAEEVYSKAETDAAIREALAEEGWVFVGEETVKTESILRITKRYADEQKHNGSRDSPKGTASDTGYVMFTNNGQNVVNGGCTIISTVAERQFRAQAYINGGVWKEDFMCGNSGESAQIYGMVTPHIIRYEKDIPTINGVAIYCFKSAGFTIDAHFEYYVREE